VQSFRYLEAYYAKDATHVWFFGDNLPVDNPAEFKKYDNLRKKYSENDLSTFPIWSDGKYFYSDGMSEEKSTIVDVTEKQ